LVYVRQLGGKLFKRSTGQTVYQYILEQHVRRAQSLLSTTDVGLAEIASLVGLARGANVAHCTLPVASQRLVQNAKENFRSLHDYPALEAAQQAA
jgi:transcriptional regulator GlxA family with amidase domain